MKKYLAYIVLSFSLIINLHALPSGAEVLNGQVDFNTVNGHLTIGNSDKAIINWQDFSIAAGEITTFNQAASSTVLNRVVGANRSDIFGDLLSQGNVILVNPNGVLVGASGNINTGGFLASTQNILDKDFIEGRMDFSGASTAAITNLGTINADTGDVFLIAREVKNEEGGKISAKNGSVGLYAGQEVLFTTEGDKRAAVRVNGFEVPEEGLVGIENSGMIEAARIELEAAAGNVYSLAVNNSGTIAATGTETINGVVYLTGDAEINNTGTIQARNPNGLGGDVYIGENDVYGVSALSNTSDHSGSYISNRGTIDAGGDNYGGNVWISSQYANLGGNIVANGSIDGGKVTVVAENVSLSDAISATGGSGDGGQVEIYAYNRLVEIANSKIDASGADGGSIYVDGGESYVSSGNYSVVGTNGDGGHIAVTATNMSLLSANYDASGSVNGGMIRAGGDVPGVGADYLPVHIGDITDMPEADRFAANAGTSMNASGGSGAGGAISVWGGDSAAVFGEYTAQGGSDGGFIDFSSKGTVQWNSDFTDIDTGGGTFRLDPKNITISDSAVAAVQYGMILGSGYTDTLVSPADNDDFGASVSIAGTTLAVGAPRSNGSNNNSDSGEVFIFNASDSTFSDGALRQTIGSGFSIDPGIESGDQFGHSVALNITSTGVANLAVGAIGDDGFGVAPVAASAVDKGAVYLFSFTDITNFSSPTASTVIGDGYAHTLTLDVGDAFGSAVELDGASLAIGAMGDDGTSNTVSNSGAVRLYNFSSNFSSVTERAVIGADYGGTGNNISVSALAQDDFFGTDVGLDGTNLVVGAPGDDGSGSNIADDPTGATGGQGAVYLFTFSENVNFSSGTHKGTIGSGYTGTNDKNITLDIGDAFGTSVSLDDQTLVDATVGLNMAVGARGDDGFNQSSADSNFGAVYTFHFSDNVMTSAADPVIIGKGYGGGNIDVDNLGNDGAQGDLFGSGVGMIGTVVVVGATGDDGLATTANASPSPNSGAVYFFNLADYNRVPDAVSGTSTVSFANSPAMDYVHRASDISTLLNTQDVILQASNDITVDSSITASGTGGLTLQAGRSVLVNQHVNLTGGAITLIANDLAVNGVVDAYRDSGDAVITVADNIALVAGGDILIDLRNGTGNTNSGSGDVTLGNVSAGGVLTVINDGPTSGSDILQQSGDIILATGTSSFVAKGNTINLSNSSNDFGNISVESNDATVTDTDSVQINSAIIANNLNVTSGGNITDKGNRFGNDAAAFIVGGTTSLNAAEVDVDNKNNNFATLSVTSSGNLVVTDVDAIDFGATSVTGNANVLAGGNITDSGTVSINGVSVFNAGANDVILDNENNDFSQIHINGANVTVRDLLNLTVGASNASGAMMLDVGGGTVTQSGLIIADTLELQGPATFQLNNTNNQVNKIAGAVSDLDFANSKSLIVGDTRDPAGNLSHSGLASQNNIFMQIAGDLTFEAMNPGTPTTLTSGTFNAGDGYEIITPGDYQSFGGPSNGQPGDRFIATSTSSFTGLSVLHFPNGFGDITADMAKTASSGNSTIALSATADFINNSGSANVINPGSSGRFLVASNDPVSTGANRGGIVAENRYNTTVNSISELIAVDSLGDSGNSSQNKFVYRRAPIINVTFNDQTIVYGTILNTLDVVVDGLINGDTIEDVFGDAFTSSLLGARLDAGTYSIGLPRDFSSPVNLQSGNVIRNSAVLTVEKADLLVTAPSVTGDRGVANESFAPTFIGLQFDDTAPAVLPTISTNRVPGSESGTYEIDIRGASDPNYNIIFVPGEYIVNAVEPAGIATDRLQGDIVNETQVFVPQISTDLDVGDFTIGSRQRPDIQGPRSPGEGSFQSADFQDDGGDQGAILVSDRGPGPREGQAGDSQDQGPGGQDGPQGREDGQGPAGDEAADGEQSEGEQSEEESEKRVASQPVVADAAADGPDDATIQPGESLNVDVNGNFTPVVIDIPQLNEALSSFVRSQLESSL